MDEAIRGGVIGLAIGLALLGIEWMLLKKSAAEQAAKLHRAAVLDQVARNRIATMARFAAVLPFAFAFAFWYIWG
jgi:hypothetical protein